MSFVVMVLNMIARKIVASVYLHCFAVRRCFDFISITNFSYMASFTLLRLMLVHTCLDCLMDFSIS